MNLQLYMNPYNKVFTVIQIRSSWIYKDNLRNVVPKC